MKFKRFLSIFLALVMALGLLTVQASKAEADIQGTGGKLVHQGGYTGLKGKAKIYLSDLYETDRKIDEVTDDAIPFSTDTSYQGDGTKVYPIYIWNSGHTVNIVHPLNHPDGRSITTMAEGTHTFSATDIVLGYSGKHFEKGLSGHLIATDHENYAPNSVTFDIRDLGATHFYSVAGLTGDAANRPSTEAAAQGYGVTFAVYGSTDGENYTLLSSVDGIGGYGESVAESKVYNTAEFAVDLTGYSYLKLEASSDGDAAGGSYSWGDACLYTPVSANGTLASADTFSGKSTEAIDSTITYLSSLTEESSFVIGYQNSVTNPITFYKDRSYPLRIKAVGHTSDLDLLSFYAGSTSRLEIYTGQSGSTIQSDSEGVYRVEKGVTYRPTTIALSAQGTVFEHGLSAIVGPANKKATSIVYDVSGLNAQRFYSAVGITSRGNTNAASTYPYKLTFSLYGSKTGTNDSDFELIAYVPQIRAWLAGEIDEDITGYKYLKLETSSDAAEDNKINWNNSYQFNSGFAWGDACVYRVTPEETPVPTEISTVSVTAAADLTLNVGATADDTMTAPKMRFSGIGETTTVEGTKSGDTWQFSFPGIYSQHMTDTLTMELLDDSDQVADTRTYSIAQYFDSLYELGQTPEGLTSMGLTAEKFGKLATLLADILEYGAAAQVYVDYNTANPANSAAWVSGAKSGEPSAPASDTALSTAISADDRFTSANLRLANFIRISVAFKASAADRIIISNGQESTTVMLSDLTPSGGKYTYITPGLNATAFDTIYTFTLSDGTETYQTLNYSVNSYVASKFNDSTAKLASLVKAICNYGASADNYAN